VTVGFKFCDGVRTILLARGVPEWSIETCEQIQSGAMYRPRPIPSRSAQLRAEARRAEKLERKARAR